MTQTYDLIVVGAGMAGGPGNAFPYSFFAIAFLS